jgi:hypothetical protein
MKFGCNKEAVLIDRYRLCHCPRSNEVRHERCPTPRSRNSESNARTWSQVKKVKQSHSTPMEAQGEWRYSFYSFTTSALDEGERSASRPSRALPSGKGPPVPTGQEAGWAPEPVWTRRLEEKSSCLCRGSNLDRQVVQPVARHYTDSATRLTSNQRYEMKMSLEVTSEDDSLLGYSVV